MAWADQALTPLGQAFQINTHGSYGQATICAGRSRTSMIPHGWVKRICRATMALPGTGWRCAYPMSPDPSCCARLEADGQVTIANAGHLAPYLDGVETQVENGLPLGLDPEAHYPETTLTLLPGSSLTILSDGVVEAENAQRELFGFDRTRDISSKPAQEIADAAKAWGQNDDITVVTVRRNA